MKLVPKKRIVGTGKHRSGWPCVVAELQKLETDGILLDDFADTAFTYAPFLRPTPHSKEFWAGIFHHPPIINSPMPGDWKHTFDAMYRNRNWAPDSTNLLKAITLCEDVAKHIEYVLDIECISLKHPTDHNCPKWQGHNNRVLQVGRFLRNTRFIHQIEAPAGWQKVNLVAISERRNVNIKAKRLRPDSKQKVERLDSQSNKKYDELLASSVVACELWGAAANNLICECIVRGTPLIINRIQYSRALQEYLGDDYCLFWSDVSQVKSFLQDDARLQAASDQLLARAHTIPTFDVFAKQVVEFVDNE